jgi:hypothetical protein
VFGENTHLIGILKEVAPVNGVESDEKLGVAAYQNDYFRPYPCYMAVDKDGKIPERYPWHDLLGAGSVGKQKLPSWNPFSLIGSFFRMKNRIGATTDLNGKAIDGNLAGEGNILGGLFIVQRGKIVYYNHELVGYDFPYDEITQFLTGSAPEVGASIKAKSAEEAQLKGGSCGVKDKDACGKA